MFRSSRVFLVSLCICLPHATASAATSQQSISPDRVREIAGMLDDKPAGVGRPISDRAAWERLAKNKSYASVFRKAEGHLKQKLPELPDDLFLDFSRTGNRSRWQSAANRRDRRLSPLVLAECLENKGRFIPAYEALVRALCKDKTWVMPAHDRSLNNFNQKSIDIDLRSSDIAWSLATSDYLLGNKLSKDVRRLLRAEVRRRVLDPFRDMVTGKRRANWWTRTTNNWNAVCLAGVTGAALASIESRQDRALFVAAAEAYSLNFLKGFAADGYCTEGLGYWNYGFGNYVLLSEAIHQATKGKVDLLARKEALKPATFGARIEVLGGTSPAFADCRVGTRPSSAIMWFVSRRFELGLREWEAYDPVKAGSLTTSMIFSFPNSASRMPPAKEAAVGPGLRTFFDDMGILICRPKEGSTCRMGVALKGGHNGEHHNHNDVGSYVVVVGRQTILVDPGSEVYTARTFSKDRYVSKVLNSFGHPVPVVGDVLQRKGKHAKARVVEIDFTDERDTLVLDLSAAYAVEDLAKLERRFEYSRKGLGSLKVIDEVLFAQPKAFGTALITFGRWKQEEPGKLLIRGSESAVRVDIEVEKGAYAFKAEEIKEDTRTPSLPVRLGINLKEPVRSARITLTITPVTSDQGGSLLRNGSFEEDDWCWLFPKEGMGSLSTEHASHGKTSLKLVDKDRKKGSNIQSARIPVRQPGAFELRGKVLVVSGKGLGMYVRYLDKDGKLLNPTSGGKGWISPLLTLGGASEKWKDFSRRFTVPAGTTDLQIWIHSMNAAQVEAYLDDLVIAPAK